MKMNKRKFRCESSSWDWDESWSGSWTKSFGWSFSWSTSEFVSENWTWSVPWSKRIEDNYCLIGEFSDGLD